MDGTSPGLNGKKVGNPDHVGPSPSSPVYKWTMGIALSRKNGMCMGGK